MTASCSAILGVSYGTVTLLLRDTVCSANLSKESVFKVPKVVRATVISDSYENLRRKSTNIPDSKEKLGILRGYKAHTDLSFSFSG